MTIKLYALDEHGETVPWRTAQPWAIELRAMLAELLTKQETIMTALDDIRAKLSATLALVTEDSSRLDSLDTFVTGLQQQIVDLLAAAGVPQDVVDQANAVFDETKLLGPKIDAALNSGVPPAPVVPAAPAQAAKK